MRTAKDQIDAIPPKELQKFKTEAENLPTRNEQMEAAGRFLAEHLILHWNGTDCTYLLYKACVKIKFF